MMSGYQHLVGVTLFRPASTMSLMTTVVSVSITTVVTQPFTSVPIDLARCKLEQDT
jgi:hypothetical protein